MATTDTEGIRVVDLLKLIPEDLLSELSLETNVDYQVKKLYGRDIFTLLLYGLIESERLGLRSLQDFYSSTNYKYLFNIPAGKTIKYNSISARLATMNVEFFRKAYEAIYEECSELYGETDLSLKHKITRVDSTMVCQTATKLEKGINVGCKKNGKKQIKYTISLTEMFPSSVEVFNQQCHINENLTIPKAIFRVMDKNRDNVFVFDRGVSDRETFCKLDEDNYSFVTRLKSDARFEVIEEFEVDQLPTVRNLTILKDQRIHLYRSGKHIVEHSFRLIQTINEKGLPYFFLSNMFNVTAKDIVSFYKKRWDIEVFFRFIKQELNFKHFISVNENGIKILLYMTLILSMLILIYKKCNGWGYKTSKRRFMIEMWDIINEMLIKHTGGDPSRVFR